MSRAPQTRVLLTGTAVAAVLLVVGLVLDAVVVPPLLRAAFDGDSPDGFWTGIIQQHHAANPGYRTLDLYLTKWGRACRLYLLFCVLVELAVVAFAYRERVTRALRAFVREPESPINLAVFRIVLFATVYSAVDRERIVFFSGLPDVLLFPPTGLGSLLAALPRNPALADTACTVLQALCITGILGFYSRTSAALVTVLGVWWLGVPHLFGKVSHQHHLLWFTAILAVSPAGRALAVDAVVAAWRRADRGDVSPPGASAAYALPLRAVMLLFGVLYFFPGFWKWVGGGTDWIFSDNLRFHVYQKWMQFEGGGPPAIVDAFPALLVLGALGTIVFELGMIIGVLFRATRPWVALAGLAFHNSTYVIMGIRFLRLQVLYVAFFDWAAIFRWIGRRLYGQRLTLIYARDCVPCRRTVATLAACDVLEGIVLEARDGAEIFAARLGDRVDTGFEAYRALAWRLPVLWPLLPLLYLWPIPPLGRRLYHLAAGSRAAWTWPLRPRAESPPDAQRSALVAVTVSLLAINVGFGLAAVSHAWPFACYPRFDSVIRAPRMLSIGVEARDASGALIEMDQRLLNQRFTRSKYRGLVRRILYAPDAENTNARLEAFWSVLGEVDPKLGRATRVRFHRDRLSTVPGERESNPISRELLYELILERRAAS